MKQRVRGVYRLWGESKAGNDFDMYRIVVEVPMESRNGKVSSLGYGFTESELALDPSALPMFAKLSFPCDLDLETDVKPVMGKFETVVVGVKQALKAA